MSASVSEFLYIFGTGKHQFKHSSNEIAWIVPFECSWSQFLRSLGFPHLLKGH
ncbi:hypothetical protein UPYG_G00051220 [Umbra pygmaea]|uniref:Uncharacterized protein n=1 Tax=Umbra pygmaea TaxID=75934 RepID=A0ABD0XAL7_UMBPY